MSVYDTCMSVSLIILRRKYINLIFLNIINLINLNPVHEHNHTRFLVPEVPEVLCSLVGPETQNVPFTLASLAFN